MPKASILIVEDEPIVVMDIQNILENNGFSVAGQADRGEDAIQKAGRFSPDLVLMDIGLRGEIDGIEAATQIRVRLGLPVIFLTAFGNPTTVQRARLAEPFGYISKPFEERELIGSIETALYKHGMEKKLRESEARYRALVETQQDAICRWLPDTTLTFVNNAYCETFGKTQAELIGKSWLMLLPEDSREEVRRRYEELARHPITLEYEHQVKAADGTIRWQAWNDVPVFDSEGRLLEFQSIGRDVTTRKQAEKELQEAERRFRDMFENVQLIAVMLDAKGYLTFCNKYLLELTGWERGEIIGKGWFDLFIPPELGIREMYEESIVKGVFPPHFENEILTRSGERRLVTWNNTMLRDLQGKAIGTASIGEDITERMQAQVALKENEIIFSSFLEQSQVYVFFKDKNIRSLRLSRNYEQMLGMPISALLGKTMDELFPSELAKSMVADDLRILNDGQRVTVVEELNGRTYETTKFPIFVDGKPDMLAGITIDVTERVQAEAASRESEARYRRLVEGAPDLVYTFSNKRGGIYYSRRAEEILGYSLEHLYAHPFLWNESIHPDDHDKVSEVILEIGHGKSFNIEYRIQDAHGDWHWLQDRSIGCQFDGDEVLIEGVATDITKRKRAEEAVVNSEKRFRALIENGRDNISLLAADGTLLWESPSTTHTLGYELDHFVGHNIFELMHPDDMDWTRDQFIQLVQEPGNSLEGVFRLLHANGSWRWIEATATNLLHEPSVQAIVINYRDITNRKMAEDELRKSESLYRQAIEVAGAVPYHQTYSENGVHVEYDFIGEGIREITGYGPEEFNEPLWDSLAQERVLLEDLAQYPFNDAIELVRSGGYPIWKCEHCIRARDGRIHWVFEAAVELRDKNGISHGSIGMFQDITSRKKAEAELRKLLLAVEQSANTIVITDVEGNIEYVNPKFVEVSGYSIPEVLGKNPRLLKSGEHSLEFYQNLWQTIKAGQVWKGAIRNRRKDGTLYWEDSTITPVYESANKMVNFIAVKEDITARKMLEEAEHDHRQLAEALRDTSAALNSTLKLDEVLDRVLDNIGKLMMYEVAMVLLIEGHTVRKIRQRHNNARESGVQPSIGNTQANLINVPVLQEMHRTRQACIIPDTQTDPRWRAIPGMSWIRSLISAPVVIRGRVAGIINILSAIPGFFTSTHSERLMVFAGQASIAIENAQLYEQAYYLSVTDPLTELMNRRHFFETARFEMERTQRYRRTLSIMMIDIDHFKKINDSHGHVMGDLVLREIARRIKNSVRAVDVVARYGGEEFIVLMPETSLHEGCQVAERVRRSVADIPIEEESVSVSVTLSIGVSEIDANSKDVDQLILYADQALYAAKAAGRNRVEGYQNTAGLDREAAA